MAYVFCQTVTGLMTEASVHVYLALQCTESKAGMTPKDISEWEELDMDRENPLK